VREYHEASTDIYDLLGKVRKDPNFAETRNVNIRIVMVTSDAPPALTQGGYPVYALIRRVPTKELCLCEHQAVMYVDWAQFKEMAVEVREALFAHELCHIEVDDAESDEPNVSLRPHDFAIGGFYDELYQFGEYAIPFQQMKAVHARAASEAPEGEQMLWDWAQPGERGAVFDRQTHSNVKAAMKAASA
jgi:hypothetical protein